MRLVHALLAAGMLAPSLLVAPSAVAAPTAPASPSDARAKVSEAVGNTIVETFADGRQAAVWLAADGSYTGEGRKHDRSSGSWRVKGNNLCFKQSHPFAFGFSFCTPVPDVGMGQPWQAKAPTGDKITVKVVPGHVSPPLANKGAAS